MVQEACQKLLTTESWVRSQCSGRGIAFTPSCFFSFFNSHLPSAPYSSSFHIVQVLTVSLNKQTNKQTNKHWSKVLLQHLTVPEIVSQFPAFYATQHLVFLLLCIYNLYVCCWWLAISKVSVWASQCCRGPELVGTMAAITIILALALIMVMAEEFHQLPEILQTMSSVLMLHRNRRTAFICCVVVLMSAASSVSLVVSSGSEVWLRCLARENLVLHILYRSSSTHC